MTIEQFLKDMEVLEQLAKTYDKSVSQKDMNMKILGFLRGQFYTGVKWDVTDGMNDREYETYVRKENAALWEEILPVLEKKESVFLGTEEIDMIHIAATTQAYMDTLSLIPHAWAGWAGDLATGTRDTQNYMEEKKVSASEEAKEAKEVIGNESYSCGMEDIKNDADGIYLAKAMEEKSIYDVMQAYYITEKSYLKRFEYLGTSIDSSYKVSMQTEELAKHIKENMESIYDSLGLGIYRELAPKATPEVEQACDEVLAEIILNR